MKKKYTATIDESLRDKANELAKKKGMTLSQFTERWINNAIAAQEIVERMGL
jgi:antitoxin component of RelBE/YafQ-DinJ toxin-antitoxin module